MKLFRLKIPYYTIPKNNMNINFEKNEGIVIIYKKRLKKSNDGNDDGFMNYFPYEYENVSGLFHSNKCKLFNRIYRIVDFGQSKLILLNLYQSFLLEWFNKNTFIQSSSKLYKMLVLLVSILMLISTLNTCSQNKNNQKFKIEIIIKK